jgi:hypothetical protein
MKKSDPSRNLSASELISNRIAELGDWRGTTLSRMRALIKQADPRVVEEWKWVRPSHPGTAVWSHDGIICTGELYKKVVKLSFPRGASLPDPAGLFNSSLTGNVRRAIDIHEGETIDASAFKALVRQAVSLNRSSRSKPPAAPRPPRLLGGAAPWVANADGDAAVQACIAAMPAWKRDVARRLDALIVRTVPGVRKAVKWNSPFYGIDGQGWFLNVHCFTKFVQVAFFRGTSLRPPPPGESRHDEVRHLDIREDERLDEALVASWIRQASKLPGWVP